MNRTNTNQMRVAIYARVSSERQAEKELSIPAQLKALKKYALGRGWDVAATRPKAPGQRIVPPSRT